MKKSVRTGLLIVLSFAILLGVVAWVGFEDTLRGLERAGVVAFLALGLLQLLVMILQTLAWRVLNRPVGHKVRSRTLFAANLVGYAVNVITPSAYLGGEPAKVLYVGRRTRLPYPALAGTVVLAKYLEAMSFFLFFTTATVISIIRFRDDLFSANMLPVGLVLVALGSVLLVVCVALWLSLTLRRFPLTRLVTLVSRIRPRSRFFARLRNRTREMEGQVNTVFCEERAVAIRGFAIFLVIHILIFLRPAIFILLANGQFLGIGEMGLIFVASQGLLAFQVTPGSVGTLDGGLLGVFSVVVDQYSAATCMAFLLITRFWDGILVGIGAFLGARIGTSMLTDLPSGKEVGLTQHGTDEEEDATASTDTPKMTGTDDGD